jgi:hypothetical protein
MKPTKDQLDRAARCKSLSKAEEYLFTHGIQTFGIESVSVAGRTIRYVNLGDTYDQTVIAEGIKLSVGSWGGWYEEAEQDHCEAEGVIRCGYCGQFTPVDDDWLGMVCQHCGNLVGG